MEASMIVTTGNDIAGRTIKTYLGVVRGIVVRSPSIAQGIMGGLKQVVGATSNLTSLFVRMRVRKLLTEWLSTLKIRVLMP
jgi:uncharacterized protein YbjQ (UPF0145 family)